MWKKIFLKKYPHLKKPITIAVVVFTQLLALSIFILDRQGFDFSRILRSVNIHSDKSDVSYRDFIPERDAVAIAALLRQIEFMTLTQDEFDNERSFAKKFGHILPYKTPEEMSFANFTAPQTMARVAVIDKQIVGFITFSKEAMPNSTDQVKTGVVSLLGVDARQRHKGIGSTLLKFAEDHFQQIGVAEILVTVKHDNIASKDFYKKAGFDVSYEIPGNLGLAMTKRLP